MKILYTAFFPLAAFGALLACSPSLDSNLPSEAEVTFIPELAGTKIDENTPYWNQRANANKPEATCCLTSAVMVIGNALLDAGVDANTVLKSVTPDKMFNAYGDRSTCGDAMPWQCHPGLRNLLVEEGAKWTKRNLVACESERATEDDIQRLISRKIPVIMHGYFTKGGHCVVLNGYSFKSQDRSDWTLKVHDPYGKWSGVPRGGYASQDKNSLGSNESQKGIAQTYSYLAVRDASYNDPNFRLEFIAEESTLKGLDLSDWDCKGTGTNFGTVYFASQNLGQGKVLFKISSPGAERLEIGVDRYNGLLPQNKPIFDDHASFEFTFGSKGKRTAFIKAFKGEKLVGQQAFDFTVAE